MDKPNGTGIDDLLLLPEAIRDYLLSPSASDWKPAAILVRIRMAGVESTLEFLRAADYARECAAYRDRGFTLHPKTGEEL